MSAIPMRYRSAYTWTGADEAGEIAIEGLPVLRVGSPHAPERYSPEHLLVVAAETCLANYVLVIARMSGLVVQAYRSSAEGELEQEGPAAYRFRQIVIRPRLVVAGGSQSLARRVVAKAHAACLIARSLSCPVEIEPTIEAGSDPAD